ncbi:MAG: hypothetical protein WCW87_00450 [Candidatus Paceibacterota bacterium]
MKTAEFKNPIVFCIKFNTAVDVGTVDKLMGSILKESGCLGAYDSESKPDEKRVPRFDGKTAHLHVEKSRQKKIEKILNDYAIIYNFGWKLE